MTNDQLTSYSHAAYGTAFFGIFAFIVIIGLIAYIFTAIGLMKMADRSGINNAWLAWLPIGNMYILGELVTSKLNGKGGKYTLYAVLATIVLGWIPIFGTLVSIAFAVYAFVLYYWLFLKYSKNPVLHLVLSIIISPYSAFAIFALRNREPSY